VRDGIGERNRRCECGWISICGGIGGRTGVGGRRRRVKRIRIVRRG
jgi:hypothetical protein